MTVRTVRQPSDAIWTVPEQGKRADRPSTVQPSRNDRPRPTLGGRTVGHPDTNNRTPKQEEAMSKALVGLAALFVGGLLGIGYTVGIEHYAPNTDGCVRSAVQVYPSLAGSELKLADLKECQRLSDGQLAIVRTELQNFGVQAAQNIEAGK